MLDEYLDTDLVLLWDLLGITGKVKIPSSLADKESNTVVYDMRIQWVSPTAHSGWPKLLFYLCLGWEILFHPSCRRHIWVPVRAERAVQGEPPQHLPVPSFTIPRQALLLTVCLLQPAPNSYYGTDALSTGSTGVPCQWDVPKSRGSSRPLLGSTGEKFSGKEISAASTFNKDVNTNPPPDVPLFPGFPVRTLPSF